MAAITANADNINPLNHESTERLTFIAAEAITAGQLVYLLANGKVGVVVLATGGKKNPVGVALKSCGAGQACGVQLKGLISGYAVSGLSAGDLVYAGATGGLDTAAGTPSVVVGKVFALADSALTKVVYLNVPQNILTA